MGSNRLNSSLFNPYARGRTKAQAILEFALILPLLMAILYGIVEFGRLIFIYSSLVTSAREGARYGAASGGGMTDIHHYQDCEGIEDAAKRAAVLISLDGDDQIQISYERLNVDTNTFEVIATSCPAPGSVKLGDRIVVQTSALFSPIIPIFVREGIFGSYMVSSVSHRTILREIYMGEGGAPGEDYSPPVVTFLAEQQTTREDTTVDVRVLLSNIATFEVVVPYTVSGTATPGADYQILAGGSIVIPPGQQSTEMSVSLSVDGVDEPIETLVLTMGEPTHATLGVPNVHTIYIEDIDGTPTVSFLQPSSSIQELAGVQPVGVLLSGRSAFPIEVSFSVVGGTATTDDYTVSTLNPLVIPPMSSGANIVLLLNQDGLDEDDETVVLKINSVLNADLVAPDSHIVTILDSDPPPDIYFTLNSQRAPEGVTASVVAQLSKITTRYVRVPFTVTSKDATSPSDYVLKPIAPSNVTYLEIPPGSLEATLKFDLIKENPDGEEKDEIIVIAMQNPLNNTAILSTPNTHELTIGKVSTPEVFFAFAELERGETSGTISIAVQLSNVWTQDVTVNFSLDPASTATLGTDYNVLTTSPLTIPAGSAYSNIMVEILKDAFDEDNETVIFHLSAPVNATLDTKRDDHTLTIKDENAYPSVQFSTTTTRVYENEGTVDVKVELSSASSKDITVEFSLDKTSTAILGATQDFTYVPNNVLVIPAGQTSAVIKVTLYDDVENDNGDLQFVEENYQRRTGNQYQTHAHHYGR